MREIKFRAWDTKGKYVVMNPLNFPELYPINELMQYTGLKDKNGKDIYEGDILQCKCGFWRFDGKKTDKISIKNYEVKWEQSKGRWNLYKNNKFELLQPFNSEAIVKWYTVIGNIHEKPELLTVDSDRK